MNIRSLRTPLIIVATVIVTALAIYLTPLRNIALVDPGTKDIDPALFEQDFTAHPADYLFIDVRPASEYSQGHATGAINVPIETLFDQHYTLPKTGKTIVLICTGGRLSGVAYGYLEHHGFLNLRRITGGTQNWIVEGEPITKGMTATNQ